jgi:hypothetical protein
VSSLVEAVQAQLRSQITTAGHVNEDWHAFLDLVGIPAGQLAERVVAYYASLYGDSPHAGAALQYFLHNPSVLVGSVPSFSPLELFASGEQGVWYDPSDMSTLFQDSAGTTPVTAVEQPVGLMLDKSKGLVLGSELVTNGGFGADSNWTKGTNTVISSGVATATSQSSGLILEQSGYSFVVGKTYEIAITISGYSAGGVNLRVGNNTLNNITVPSANGSYTYKYAVTNVATQTFSLFCGSTTTLSIDNISVKELPGNHATQATASAKPVLSARVNLLTQTEAFDNAAWVKAQVSVTPDVSVAPNGATTADGMFEVATTNSHFFRAGAAGAAPGVAQYRATLRVKANGRTKVQLLAEKIGQSQWAGCTFNLSNNTFNSTPITAGGTSFVSASILDDLQGFKVITVVATSTSLGMDGILVCLLDDAASETVIAPSYAGDASKGVYLWGADLRVSNDGTGLPAYQRVTTSTDYDTTGFPMYLKFDGVDDSMATGSISFTSTDKMGVFAGVRKVNDTASMMTELSVASSSNVGSWHLVSGNDTGALGTVNGYTSLARGSAAAATTQTGQISQGAPDTAVIAVTHDIAGDLSTLRRNGVAGTNGTGDKGTGNFGNYPIYIGRRGGSSLPLNGRIYGLVVRGAASDATQISNTETYLNTKTKAY